MLRRSLITILPIAAAVLAPAQALAETLDLAAPPPAEPPPVEPAADAAEAPFRRRLFFGATGGIGFAAVKHPELSTPRVYGALMAMELGWHFSPRWSVGIEFTNMEKVVSRDSGGERFGSATQWIHSQAECNTCGKPALPGGPVLSYNMLLSTVGPRVDVTPFGQNGLYLGGSGGLAIVSLLDPRFGAGGTAHVGLRYTVAEIVTFGVEGGVQGQVFQGGTTAMAYGGAMLRLSMIEPAKKSAPAKSTTQVMAPVRSR